MKRRELLNIAADLIDGDRAKNYGDAKDNFVRIAKTWEVVLGHEVTPEQVALCMIGVKLARLANSSEHEDSWIDIAGYAALGGECASGSQ